MTLGPAVRYPAGTITPHGAYELLHDRIPWVALRSHDDSVVFNLMGGLAIADRLTPERVELHDVKGLSAPWTTIDQKGATQDGVSFVDALYDPIEVNLGVKAVGRDPAHLRKVVRDLWGALDIKDEAELSWFTHDMGRWWTKVRWFKPADDPVTGIANRTQKLLLRLRADSGFWESYPNVDQFRFTYNSDSDGFDYLTAEGDPIAGWTLIYSGGGTGKLFTDGAQAISTLSGSKTVVARRTSYTCSSDNMGVEVVFGTNIQWNWPNNTYIDLWARMANSGTAGQDGVRCRIGINSITVSAFVSGTETVLRRLVFRNIPRSNEKFTFVAGLEGEARTFKVLRNNALVLTVKETGTTSQIGASYRKVGFGMAVTSGTVRPLALKSWAAGSSASTAQEGYLERINVGDQPMWDRYTCFGPGIFYIANGPGSSEYVKFGPLLPGQVMQIRTDPRKRGVVDMSAKPVSSQTAAQYKKALADYQSFLSVGGVSPNDSVFGVLTPQGNPYTLMKGRFSRPVPPRSPGGAIQPYHVAVKIDNGSSDSQIIATGTPLRRLPY